MEFCTKEIDEKIKKMKKGVKKIKKKCDPSKEKKYFQILKPSPKKRGRKKKNTNWLYFSYKELKCRCGCQKMEMDNQFMERLEALRINFGQPMIILQGYQ